MTDRVKAASCPTCGRSRSDRSVAVDEAAKSESSVAAPWSNPNHLPFCSKRCQEVDLYRWSQGRYAIIDPMTPDLLAETDFEQEEFE